MDLITRGEMKALDILRSDHQRFLRALGALEVALLSPPCGSRIGVENVTRFFLAEIDAHVKAEEGMLYPTLAFHAPTKERFLSLEAEHSLVRLHLGALGRALAEAGPGEVTEAVAREGRALVRSFVQHIFTEEHVLFPLVEKLVSGSELEEVGKAIWALKWGELSSDPLTAGD